MAVLGYCGAARGSNFTWNNTNSDATNPASWNSNAPGTFPSATTDVVTFPAAGTIVQPVFNTFVSGGVTQSSTTLSMMIFQGAGYSVTGNRISLNTNVNPLSVPAEPLRFRRSASESIKPGRDQPIRSTRRIS